MSNNRPKNNQDQKQDNQNNQNQDNQNNQPVRNRLTRSPAMVYGETQADLKAQLTSPQINLARNRSSQFQQNQNNSNDQNNEKGKEGPKLGGKK